MAKWYEAYVTCWGSEEPSNFARVLAETIPIEKGVTKLLDIGCGSGIIGIYSLIEHKAYSVTFNDLLPKWIDITRCNVDIKVREGEIQEPQVKLLKAGRFVDIPDEVVAQHTLVAFNPPQLPEQFVDEKTLQTIRTNPTESEFRLAGLDGLKRAHEFLRWYGGLQMSKPKPDAVILLSSFLRQSLIEQTIADCGLQEVTRERTHGIVLRDIFDKNKISKLKPDEIKDRLLEPYGHGWWTKSLLTIRLKNR